MKRFPLHYQILIAFILAVLTGIFLPTFVPYITWMGTIFLRLLRMIIVPLILSSIISGITSIGGTNKIGKLGLKTISYYLLTSILSITTGLVFVNLFKPGIGADVGLEKEVEGLGVASESFGSTILNIIPENIFQSLLAAEMLQIIFFAFLFGFFIMKTSRKSKEFLITLFDGVFEVMMKFTMFIIKLAPFGIFGIVAGVVVEQENLGELIGSMGLYMLTVFIALLVHAAISLPVLLRLIGKIKPLKHFQAMYTPLLTAFSTSSSSATLPLTINAVEQNAGVSNKVSSFTLPLGATINMDGTALYEIVAAIFIAQAYGMELTIIQQLLVVFTALLASIGAAGIPMAGLVMISIVLSAIGLPLEGVGLILSVDRILDMFRTSVNVWSDTCGAAIIASSEGEVLKVSK